MVPALPLADGARCIEFGGFRFAVFPRHGGRAPELEDRATLEWIGRFIGRIHAVGALQPFAQRPALDIATFGDEPRDYLLAHGFIPPDLRDAYAACATQALDGVRRCFERAGDVRMLRLHGDCHAGNVLWTDAGPHFVDFDDSRMGPAMQDLWMLLSGERADMARQLADVLAGYEDFCEFDPRELHLVEALRTLRLIHYAAWLARRWDDPAFPAAFPVVQHAALLAGPHPRIARADRADGRAAAVAGVTGRLSRKPRPSIDLFGAWHEHGKNPLRHHRRQRSVSDGRLAAAA